MDSPGLFKKTKTIVSRRRACTTHPCRWWRGWPGGQDVLLNWQLQSCWNGISKGNVWIKIKGENYSETTKIIIMTNTNQSSLLWAVLYLSLSCCTLRLKVFWSKQNYLSWPILHTLAGYPVTPSGTKMPISSLCQPNQIDFSAFLDKPEWWQPLKRNIQHSEILQFPWLYSRSKKSHH